MKNVRKLVLLITTGILLAGCAPKADTTDTTATTGAIKTFETNEDIGNIKSNIKNYMLKTDREELIPQIMINEDDKTFTFSYDVLSSYLTTGSYTEKDGQLELKTDDGKYHYTFDIVDENTLKFNQENSSDIKVIMGEGIEDGAEFIIDISDTEPIMSTSEIDMLRNLYVDFPQSANYQEAIAFIQESGLPYSEKKFTGSRHIKIALKESDTVIEEPVEETFKDYDYIVIDYMYPKMEDGRNDELDKYLFTGIAYLSAEGKYQLESHIDNNYISTDQATLDSLMNRQEQMHFLKNHTGLAIAQREPVSADVERCIREEFATFDQECELIDLWYDKEKSDQVIDSYMKYGKGSVDEVKRENIIVIMSDIKTGENTWSFESNTIYTDWNWILIRDNQDSEWVVEDYGNY